MSARAFFFLVSLYFLIVDAPLIGAVGTGYGLSVLAVMVVDWGGAVTQRQAMSVADGAEVIKAYARMRLLPLLGTLGLVLCGELLGSPFPNATEFVAGAVPGITVSILSLTGFLDVIDKKAVHGYLHGAPALCLATYLLTGGRDPFAAGLCYSIGQIVISLFQLQRARQLSKWRDRRRSHSRMSTRTLFVEGGHVLVSSLPGQLVARVIPMLLGGSGPAAAAVYNTLKQAQGLLNQAATLMRRVEFNHARHVLEVRRGWKDIFLAQRLTLASGMASGLAGVFLLAVWSKDMDLDPKLWAIFFAQSVVWLFTSSYFYAQQVLGSNFRQSLYGIVFLAIFALGYFLARPSDVAVVIAVEMLAAVLSFFAIYKFIGKAHAVAH